MKRLLIVCIAALLSCGLAPLADASIFHVWTDTNNDGAKDFLLGSINGYEGTLTGKNNYDYYSHSGHPVNGPNPQAHRLKFFVYERTTNNRDFLNIIGGADEKGHQNHWHDFSLDIDIWGSTLDPRIVRGDENREFNETSEDHFEGDWSFKYNSDGGVIGGLKGDWEARIVFNDTELNRHVFASDGSQNININEYLFEKEYDTYFISYTDQLPGGQAVIPEPATMLMFSTGLLGAFARRRMRI